MRVSDLRVGMPLLGGRIYVIHLKRRGAYSDIELSDGQSVKRVTLHKAQSIMTALVGTMRSESTDQRTWVTVPHVPRVSDPIWRGERTHDTLPHGDVAMRQPR